MSEASFVLFHFLLPFLPFVKTLSIFEIKVLFSSVTLRCTGRIKCFPSLCFICKSMICYKPFCKKVSSNHHFLGGPGFSDTWRLICSWWNSLHCSYTCWRRGRSSPLLVVWCEKYMFFAWLGFAAALPSSFAASFCFDQPSASWYKSRYSSIRTFIKYNLFEAKEIAKPFRSYRNIALKLSKHLWHSYIYQYAFPVSSKPKPANGRSKMQIPYQRFEK